MDQQLEAGPSSGPHRMRITSGGSIPSYVKFAVGFLLDNPERPLVLHTLPSDDKQSNRNAKSPKRTTKLHSCTTTVPRLISVVEQVKREFIRSAPGVGNGKRKAKGIWQYTESGLLAVPEAQVDEEEIDPLIRVLEGKTKPKMTHRPFLQITLSPKPLGVELGEEGRSVTCQYTLIKRRKGVNEPLSDDSEKEGETMQEDPPSATMAIDMGEEEDMGVAVNRRTLASAPSATVKKLPGDGQKRKSLSDRDAGAKRLKNGTSGTKSGSTKSEKTGGVRKNAGI